MIIDMQEYTYNTTNISKCMYVTIIKYTIVILQMQQSFCEGFFATTKHVPVNMSFEINNFCIKVIQFRIYLLSPPGGYILGVKLFCRTYSKSNEQGLYEILYVGRAPKGNMIEIWKGSR